MFSFAVEFALPGSVRAGLPPNQAALLPPAPKDPVVFARDIKPILELRCLQCHGKGRDKGGFRVDDRAALLRGGDSGPAVVPGHGTEGMLIALVSGLDPDEVMPKKGKLLTPTEVGLLRAWIDQGVPWDPDVTFARPAPRNLAPPQPGITLAADSKENPVDQILAPYFKAKAIPAGAVVDDRAFARRAYMDLLGLLAPPAELESFVADAAPDKRARLAARLLADDRHYAEHWLTFWNDLLRNDYRGTGYIDGGRESISRWLYSALCTNMPYNQFVAELVSPVPGSSGFTKGIVWRGTINSSQTPQMQAGQGISQVFMGVNIKCASCHDSFVNDWRLSDAYGMAAVFNDGPLEMFQCDKPTGKMTAAKFLYPQVGEIDPKLDKPARVRRLAELLTSPANGRLPRTIVNRFWARLFGRGLVEPVDDMEQAAWNPDVLDWLAKDLIDHQYNLRHTLEVLVTSRAYQMPALGTDESAVKEFVFRGPLVRRLSAEQFHDALSQITGVWYDKSELPAITNEVRACAVAADPLAVAMDRPNREQIITSRASAATTLQALELTHGQTLANLLHRAGEKLATPNVPTEALVGQIYQTALGRHPTGAEAEIGAELVGSPARADGVEDLLWAVAMLPEFQLIH